MARFTPDSPGSPDAAELPIRILVPSIRFEAYIRSFTLPHHAFMDTLKEDAPMASMSANLLNKQPHRNHVVFPSIQWFLSREIQSVYH